MKKPVMLPIIAILVTAGMLFAVSSVFDEIATQNKQKEQLRLMQTLLPDSEVFVMEPYSGENEDVRSVYNAENGYVIETVTYGYVGEITMYIGVNLDGKVTGLVVRDQAETFGLGAQALTDHVFLKQFLNSSGSFEVATSGADIFSAATGVIAETEGDTVKIDALTGATVTSKAIVRAVNSAVAYVTGADADSAATSWGGK